MTAEFIQSCGSDSDLLRHYAKRDGLWMKAGRKIKKAIADTGFYGYFPFTIKNLNHKPYFEVERFRYKGELYASVTNSAINYIFKIHNK
ncbi:MAG: hypothetical protein KBG19_04395 [Bacteroidales bacterium]|nr:hypothetical protein [Bacteroidales bacterium]